MSCVIFINGEKLSFVGRDVAGFCDEYLILSVEFCAICFVKKWSSNNSASKMIGDDAEQLPESYYKGCAEKAVVTKGGYKYQEQQ